MSFLTSRRDGGVATLVMDEPGTRNALSMPEQCLQMIEALEALNDDPSVRVAILTGSGPAFCAGGNVKHMQAREGLMAGSAVEIAERYRRTLQRLAQALHSLQVPVIAAVNGPAIGAGLDLCCMCDIRIAAETARFAETFVKLGLVSGIGGAWFLPRAIGQARAAEMAFTGRVIDAAAALDLGLVSRVVAPELLMTEAQALADEIAGKPSLALRYTKRLLRLSERAELPAALEATAALQALAHQSEEHAEAVGRYLASREARRTAAS